MGVDFENDFPQPPTAQPATVVPLVRRWRFRDDAPVEIALLHPIVCEGEPPIEIDRITVRRITAGEMIEVVESIGSDVDDETLIRHVTAAMAGVDIDVLGALSPDDAGRVAAAALPFMPGGLVAAIERANAVEEAKEAAADAA